MANSVRKNTVKLVFGPDSKVPSHLEVLKFTIANLKLSAADIHSIYKEENGGQFYVKLMDEPTFSAFIADSEEQYTFKFDDGTEANVQVDQACRIFRYVRIFNLPPEIEDREIQYVLGQYGTIRQHVRERFPSEVNVNIYTGVRGVHMEVSKEIPAHLYVGHFRARIYYDGLKNKCFYCKAEGHEKSNCPKLTSAASGEAQRAMHSSKTTGSTSLGRPSKPVIDAAEPTPATMTVLSSKHRNTKTAMTDTRSNESTSTTSQPLQNIPTTPVGNHVAPTDDIRRAKSDVSTTVGTQNEYMDDETSEKTRSNIKRVMITSSEGSDFDENLQSEQDGKLPVRMKDSNSMSDKKGTKPKKNRK